MDKCNKWEGDGIAVIDRNTPLDIAELFSLDKVIALEDEYSTLLLEVIMIFKPVKKVETEWLRIVEMLVERNRLAMQTLDHVRDYEITKQTR